MEESEGGEKKKIGGWTCLECGKDFPRRMNLRKHMHVHLGERFECGICARSFTRISNLRAHCRRKHLEGGHLPKYACEECSGRFETPYELRRHSVVHEENPRPFRCDACGKGLAQQSHLKRHMRACKARTGDGSLQCSTCNRSFSSPSDLRRHVMVHSGEQPFACTVCEKRFSQAVSLQRHELIHRGEQPFGCHTCDRRYREKHKLRKHILEVHGEAEPDPA